MENTLGKSRNEEGPSEVIAHSVWGERWQHCYREVVGFERHLGGGIIMASLPNCLYVMEEKGIKRRVQVSQLETMVVAAMQNKGQLRERYRPYEQYTRHGGSEWSKRKKP